MNRIFLAIIYLLMPLIAQGASLDVVINEIAWMGTENSANDEWIELYNNTSQNINLDNWGIYEGETLIEPLSGIIKAKSYYLIERTDDETVPNIPASQEPSGWAGHGLKNSGEHLKLLNNSVLIDEVNCQDSWFAGDNKSKSTMERINTLVSGSSNWQTSKNPGGTPKKKNYESKIMNQEEDKLENKEKAEVKSLPSYPTGIVFNEILPSPEGPDAENEWIEIFNQNDFEVNLFQWKIKDKEGKITAYAFPKETSISSKGYLVLFRSLTKITLNNSKDGLFLIQPNEEIIDSVIYEKAPQNQSYNKTESGWSWSNTLTLGKANILPKKSSSGTEYSDELLIEKQTAESGKKSNKLTNTSPDFNVFLIAIILAVFSATAVLVLKRKTKNCPD